MILGSAVTIEAPAHGERLVLPNHLHFVDPPVAGDTTNTAIDMGAMVEIDKIWEVVDPNPIDRGTRFEAIANGFEFVAVYFDFCVAIHTSLGGWNGGMLRFLDGVVAVPAVHTKLSNVECMTIRDWLSGSIPYPLSIRVGDSDRHRDYIQSRDSRDRGNHFPDLVGPLRENKFLFFQFSAQ